MLGNPATDVFETWKCGEVTSLENDVLERISYMVGIYKNLGTLFPEQRQANCCDSMKPDTNLGGIITTQTEVFYDKTTSLFFSRV